MHISEGGMISVVIPLTSSLGSEFSDILGLFKMYYFDLKKNLERNPEYLV